MFWTDEIFEIASFEGWVYQCVQDVGLRFHRFFKQRAHERFFVHWHTEAPSKLTMHPHLVTTEIYTLVGGYDLWLVGETSRHLYDFHLRLGPGSYYAMQPRTQHVISPRPGTVSLMRWGGDVHDRAEFVPSGEPGEARARDWPRLFVESACVQLTPSELKTWTKKCRMCTVRSRQLMTCPVCANRGYVYAD